MEVRRNRQALSKRKTYNTEHGITKERGFSYLQLSHPRKCRNVNFATKNSLLEARESNNKIDFGAYFTVNKMNENSILR